MKIFNGRAATEEYMSTHTLTFSTPELTLKKFALWLSEQVNMQGYPEQVPRLMLYIKDLDQEKSDKTEFNPDVDDSFRPSGAVREMYGQKPAEDLEMVRPAQSQANQRSCTECGHILKEGSKFCPKCGTKQTS